MNSCIYILKNKINGKIYVGQTAVLKQRIHHHRYCGKNPKTGERSVIHKAIKKYGFDNFELSKIECPIHELNEMEIEMIKKLNSKVPNGYNLSDGGEGVRGFKLTEEQRKKISEKKKGIPLTEEAKKIISESLIGLPKRRFIFTDINGKEYVNENCTFYQFCENYNLSKEVMTQILSGRSVKGQYHGWTVRRENEQIKVKPNYDWGVYIFTDPADKEYVVQYGGFEKFCHANLLNPDSMNTVLKGKTNQHKYWTIRRKGEPKKVVDKSYSLFWFKSPVGVEYMTLSVEKFCKENKLNISSVYKFIKGEIQNYKGWNIRREECDIHA